MLIRRSVVDSGGSVTEVMPEAMRRADVPVLLRHPPIVPASALFMHGQSVQPSWSPPSPEHRDLNSGGPIQVLKTKSDPVVLPFHLDVEVESRVNAAPPR